MQVTEPETPKSRLNFDRERTLSQISDLEREFTAIVASAADGSAGGDDEHDPEGATVALERQHVAAPLDRAPGRPHLRPVCRRPLAQQAPEEVRASGPSPATRDPDTGG